MQSGLLLEQVVLRSKIFVVMTMWEMVVAINFASLCCLWTNNQWMPEAWTGTLILGCNSQNFEKPNWWAYCIFLHSANHSCTFTSNGCFHCFYSILNYCTKFFFSWANIGIFFQVTQLYYLFWDMRWSPLLLFCRSGSVNIPFSFLSYCDCHILWSPTPKVFIDIAFACSILWQKC